MQHDTNVPHLLIDIRSGHFMLYILSCLIFWVIYIHLCMPMYVCIVYWLIYILCLYTSSNQIYQMMAIYHTNLIPFSVKKTWMCMHIATKCLIIHTHAHVHLWNVLTLVLHTYLDNWSVTLSKILLTGLSMGIFCHFIWFAVD